MPPLEQHEWAGCLRVAAISDVGMRRSNNQDHHGVSLTSQWEEWRRRGHLLIVADGMGAHAAGELASEMAVDNITHLYRKYGAKPPAVALTAAIEEANLIIHRRGQSNTAFHRMGTTCSSLLLLPQGAVVGHVGDSRVYRLRGDQLEQLTFDHSMAWEVEAATGGAGLSPEACAAIPKNVITRSLGPNLKVEVDVEGPFPLEVGDTFLLCSDGASGPVHDDEFALILGALEPDQAAQMIVDLANLRGGPDNITVIVAKITNPKMAEDPWRKEPLQLDEQRAAAVPIPVRPIPKWLWALFAVLGLTTFAMLVLQLPLISLAFGLIWLGISMSAIMYRYSGAEAILPGKPAYRMGKGPYRKYPLEPSAVVAKNLKEMTDELCEAVETNQWTVDWERFHPFQNRAEVAIEKGNYAEAIRNYFHCIGSLMSQIRGQDGHGRAPIDDSRVDL
ncbi:MAG: protein phosphatase 2C domain-containing protein [Pirellulaceae bacterium]